MLTEVGVSETIKSHHTLARKTMSNECVLPDVQPLLNLGEHESSLTWTVSVTLSVKTLRIVHVALHYNFLTSKLVEYCVY